MSESNKPQKPYYDGVNESDCYFDAEFIHVFAADHSVKSKESLDAEIYKNCGPDHEQVAIAKWRILALLNQEYKSLVFRRLMLQFGGREMTDDWNTVVDRMVAVDTVAREYSLELIGREL